MRRLKADRLKAVGLNRAMDTKLLMPHGNEYFAADVVGAEIPNLKGKVSAQPDAKTLVLVMDDAPRQP